MRIAFISANREQMPDACIPLGLLYVMASTPPHHESRLFDIAFEEEPEEYLTTKLSEFEPDLIAIGIRNIQNNDYTGISTNIEALKHLVEVVRKATGAPIVLGGAGFSVIPGELMRVLNADFGIAGEGERAFAALVNSLEFGNPAPAQILTAKNHEHSAVVGPNSFTDLNSLPLPNRSILKRDYYEKFGIDSIQTSRGCSMKCTYCTYPKIEGSSKRLLSPSKVPNEFARARDNGANHIFIVDSVFNAPLNHAKDVCRELINDGNTMPWTCYANPRSFDDELAELMADAGCTGMEVGTDAGTDEILRKLRKGFTIENVRALHKRASRFGLADCHTFILGTEGESIEDARKTLDFIIELDPFAAIIMIWTDDEEAVNPHHYTERARLREQISALLEAQKDSFPHWIIPSMGFNFDESIFKLMRKSGFEGPLWQHLRQR